ncbi:MAG: double-strand break repair helicase AddA [Parvibaculaceae bacterium]
MSAPETKKINAGDAQQLRASDPKTSVWVSANAGAGKTHALTTRVTRLLLAGTMPERILCLTYTKAAAAEMSSRLFQRLGDWAMADEEKLRGEIAAIEGPLPDAKKVALARRLFARAIETPGGLKIQTIHAFCQSVLGRFPLEADVPPHFNVLDDRSAAELLDEVRFDVLARAGADTDGPLGAALAYVVSRVNETQFDELMTEITRGRSEFARLLATHGGVDAIVGALRDQLGVLPDANRQSVISDFMGAAQFPRTTIKSAMTALESGSKTDQERSAKFAQVLSNVTELSGDHDLYVGVFLTAKDEARKDLMTKKVREAHEELHEQLREEQQRALGHIAYLKSVHVAEASEAILRIALEVLRGFEEAKRLSAFLDYDDMIAKTRALLAQQHMTPWVLYKLDGGIDHILVDEAQDTSPNQWDIVASLTDEFFAGLGANEKTRTMFAVGDEKQSIYSFQGADPQRFDEMQRLFGSRARAAELEWDPVRLVRSFRSTPQVLAAVDAVFARDEARQGLTASGEVDEHIPVRREDAGRVELWEPEVPDEAADESAWDAPLNYLSASDPKAKLAARIADTIAQWIASGEILPSKGRAIEPGDILILVRRRNEFVSEMVRLLKKKGIAVAGADRMVVTDEIAVMDLMALGSFTLMPDDDLTLAVVLKSPLVGFDEEALFELAHGRARNVTLWQALSAKRHLRADFAAAHMLLEDLLGQADFKPPFEFFSHVLVEEGGRRKLLGRLGSDANDPVDEFLSLALEYEREHAGAMQGFLHWVREGGSDIKRDMDKGRNEVRIMTVHGAKGLEAEIVFMPDTCATTSATHDPSFFKLDTMPPLLVWPVSSGEMDEQTTEARLRHQQMQAEEQRRLLYVAMTRARDRLYVCGYQGKGELKDDCWYSLIASALKPLAVALPQTDGRTIWRIDGKQQRDVKHSEAAAAVAHDQVGDWARRMVAPEPAPSRPLAPSRLPPDGMDEPAALSPLTGNQQKRFQRGTLIHRLLQTLPDLDDDVRELAARDLLASPALELDDTQRDEIITATMAVIRNPDFADIFGDGSRAEAALVGQIDFGSKPVLVSGQIDRLCVSATRVLVIDYKTNRPAPPDIAEVKPAYFAQMAAYRAVLSAIYPDHDVVCALLWTDGPKLMELPPARLDAALMRH